MSGEWPSLNFGFTSIKNIGLFCVLFFLNIPFYEMGFKQELLLKFGVLLNKNYR